VRERTLLIQRAVSLGQEKDTKTAAHRTVRLLAPLREDLLVWRLRSGRPGETGLVFPGHGGGLWTKTTYDNWRNRAFGRARRAAKADGATPYALRHSFASLLLHEGRSVVYVARQLGHDARLTLTAYGHVIDELDELPRVSAEDAIRAAPPERVCLWCVPRGGGR
jgi:integrase